MIVTFSSLLHALTRISLPANLALGTVIVLCAACGSSTAPATGGSDLLPVRTSQAGLTADGWQALLQSDAGLTALVNAQTQPLQKAGTVVAADGTTLDWAEYAPALDAPRTQVAVVFRSCLTAGADTPRVCTRGTGVYTATGATLTDDAGKPLNLVPMGAPQAWEWETSSNLDNDNSTIVAGLSGDSPPVDVTTVLAQSNAILAQKRRFVVLSSYGLQSGVDISPIAQAARDSGRFDTVETIEYVRRTDIEAVLPSLTALDTVVWVGAGVQRKSSKSSPPSNAIGMNVTRGIVGDETYYGKIAGPLLDTPPLGGPGLIVLAGQNTFLGDVYDKQSLAAAWYEPGTRPIVGFSLPLGTPGPEGYAHIALSDVIHTTTALIKNLGAGQDLDNAMAGAASGQAFTLTSPMASDNRKKWTWTAPNSSFWAKQPTTGSLTIQLSLTPNCVKPVDACDYAAWQSGVKASGMVNNAVAIVCDNPTFVGPYFTCAGGDSQPPGTKFTVHGILRGTLADDHVLFLAQGEAGGPLGGIVVVGDGVLNGDGIDIGGGTTTYKFGGQAVASPYTDTDGNCCWTQPPQLIGNSANLSALQLHN